MPETYAINRDWGYVDGVSPTTMVSGFKFPSSVG
jgi:hypothetical protein